MCVTGPDAPGNALGKTRPTARRILLLSRSRRTSTTNNCEQEYGEDGKYMTSPEGKLDLTDWLIGTQSCHHHHPILSFPWSPWATLIMSTSSVYV